MTLYTCLFQGSIQEREHQEGRSGIGNLEAKGISADVPSHWRDLLGGWYQWAIHGIVGTLSPPANSGLWMLLVHRLKSPPNFSCFLSFQVAGHCFELGNQKLGPRNPVPLQAVPQLSLSISGYQKPSISPLRATSKATMPLAIEQQFQEGPSRGRQARLVVPDHQMH